MKKIIKKIAKFILSKKEYKVCNNEGEGLWIPVTEENNPNVINIDISLDAFMDYLYPLKWGIKYWRELESKEGKTAEEEALLEYVRYIIDPSYRGEEKIFSFRVPVGTNNTKRKKAKKYLGGCYDANIFSIFFR